MSHHWQLTWQSSMCSAHHSVFALLMTRVFLVGSQQTSKWRKYDEWARLHDLSRIVENRFEASHIGPMVEWFVGLRLPSGRIMPHVEPLVSPHSGLRNMYLAITKDLTTNNYLAGSMVAVLRETPLRKCKAVVVEWLGCSRFCSFGLSFGRGYAGSRSLKSGVFPRFLHL